VSDRIKYEDSNSALADRYAEETGEVEWNLHEYVRWLEGKVREYEADKLDNSLKNILKDNGQYEDAVQANREYREKVFDTRDLVMQGIAKGWIR